MKRFVRPFLIAGVSICLLGCVVEEPVVETTETAEPSEPATGTAEAATLSEGFSTPESVLYDPEQDVYYVSNINGAPLDADGNGYISRITAGDHQVIQKWIDGSAEGYDLHAPKGMAILGDELWVSDIDQVRRFARTTGEPRGSIVIEGSTFLNDVAAGSDAIYVSDSGLNAEFQSTGTDQIYRITPSGEVETLATESNLGSPNGVVVIDGEVWVVTFQGNELYRLADGKKTDSVTLPSGGLDGIVVTSDGSLLTSSWEGSAIYKGTSTGPFTAIIEDMPSPADLGFDTKRNLVLIPLFQDDRVEIRPLESTRDTTATTDTTATAQ